MAFGPEIGTTSTVVPERRPERDSAEQAPNSVAGPAPKPVTNGGKFGKNLVYSRKEQVIPDSVRVQESDPPPLHEKYSWTQTLTTLTSPLPLEREPELAPNSHVIPYQISYPLKDSLLPIKPFSQT
ncbi:Retrovirus-related Pol polyprotein from transposon TNT 1-94 [Sesbania bispinosa]|nr:Retrovirus-related Pol polyprotein from transposon TNT 1-94 [Sesbania bispinosa]